jgi:hypothetical protein
LAEIWHAQRSRVTRPAQLARDVAPFQSSIGSNLQSCASSGLYFGITTDQDITSALATLFNTAVQSVEAHLSN